MQYFEFGNQINLEIEILGRYLDEKLGNISPVFH